MITTPLTETRCVAPYSSDTIRLFGITPDGPDLIETLSFNIRFLETSNDGSCEVATVLRLVMIFSSLKLQAPDSTPPTTP